MQNKANFKNVQMDIKLNISSDYEKILHWTFGENKPNQSQLRSVEKLFYKLIIAKS